MSQGANGENVFTSRCQEQSIKPTDVCNGITGALETKEYRYGW